MRKFTDNTTSTSGLSQWYPMNLGKATVSAKTASYTIPASEMGTNFTNAGASGTITFTLPSAALVPNKTLRFSALAAQIVRVDPEGSEKVYYNGSGEAGKYLNLAGVIGNFVEVFSDGTDWIATYGNGVLTKEA